MGEKRLMQNLLYHHSDSSLRCHPIFLQPLLTHSTSPTLLHPIPPTHYLPAYTHSSPLNPDMTVKRLSSKISHVRTIHSGASRPRTCGAGSRRTPGGVSLRIPADQNLNWRPRVGPLPLSRLYCTCTIDQICLAEILSNHPRQLPGQIIGNYHVILPGHTRQLPVATTRGNTRERGTKAGTIGCKL